MIRIKRHILFLGICSGCLFGSCVQHRDLISFQESQLPLGAPTDITNFSEVHIQPNDVLRITVHSFNEMAAQPFNLDISSLMQSGAAASNPSVLLLTGYMVDSLGMINFPVLGQVKLGGLTLHTATDTLQAKLLPYLRDAVVNMRFLNYRYTILGEVNTPGTYTTMNKRLTLLEAIGTAGDLTNYANRENILVIREQDGKREFARLNLKRDEVFVSSFFYLQQNDIIYVEPTKAKVAVIQDPVLRYITFGSAGLSLITLIISLVK